MNQMERRALEYAFDYGRGCDISFKQVDNTWYFEISKGAFCPYSFSVTNEELESWLFEHYEDFLDVADLGYYWDERKGDWRNEYAMSDLLDEVIYRFSKAL